MSTELEASSRAQTHTRASSSGRLQSAAKAAMFSVTRRSSSDGRPGDGQRVLAQGPLGQMADHRAHLQPEEHRPDGGGPLAEQVTEAAHGILIGRTGPGPTGRPAVRPRAPGRGPGPWR